MYTSGALLEEGTIVTKFSSMNVIFCERKPGFLYVFFCWFSAFCKKKLLADTLLTEVCAHGMKESGLPDV